MCSCVTVACTSSRRFTRRRTRPLVEHRGWQLGERDRNRLWSDRVLICYDSEFPELTRHLADQGTDPVRAVLHRRAPVLPARALLLPGARGRKPVLRRDVGQRRQPAGRGEHGHPICAELHSDPCDFPFARDGIAADTTPNAEMVAFADLRPRHCAWRATAALRRTCATAGTTSTACSGAANNHSADLPQTQGSTKATNAAITVMPIRFIQIPAVPSRRSSPDDWRTRWHSAAWPPAA